MLNGFACSGRVDRLKKQEDGWNRKDGVEADMFIQQGGTPPAERRCLRSAYAGVFDRPRKECRAPRKLLKLPVSVVELANGLELTLMCHSLPSRLHVVTSFTCL
jgi:hypothetical protein